MGWKVPKNMTSRDTDQQSRLGKLNHIRIVCAISKPKYACFTDDKNYTINLVGIWLLFLFSKETTKKRTNKLNAKILNHPSDDNSVANNYEPCRCKIHFSATMSTFVSYLSINLIGPSSKSCLARLLILLKHNHSGNSGSPCSMFATNCKQKNSAALTESRLKKTGLRQTNLNVRVRLTIEELRSPESV